MRMGPPPSSPASQRSNTRTRGGSTQKQQQQPKPPRTRSPGNNANSLTNHAGGTVHPSHSTPYLPCISPLRQSSPEFPATHSISKYPAALAMPMIPPTKPRKLAELPNSVTAQQQQQRESIHYLSASRRLHLPPDAMVVMLTSPGSSASSFPSNAYVPMTGESPWLEPLPQQDGNPIYVQFPMQQPQPYHLQPQPPLPVTSRSPSLSMSNQSVPVFAIFGNESGDDRDIAGNDGRSTSSQSSPHQTSHEYTQAFETTGSLPHSRTRTRQGRNSVASNAGSSGDDFFNAVVSTVPHLATKNSKNNSKSTNSSSGSEQRGKSSTRLSDLTDAPSKMVVSSNVKLLNEFLRQHAAQDASGQPPSRGDRLKFSEEEQEEIVRLITDLQVFVSPPAATSPVVASAKATAPTSGDAPPLQQPQEPKAVSPRTPKPAETTRAVPEAQPPASSNSNNNNGSSSSSSSSRRPISELHMVKAKPMPPLKLPEERAGATKAVAGDGNNGTATTTAAAATADPRRSSAQIDNHAVAEKQSVEGRYREALKTIEEAASDCKLALQRVQDYSESLFILVETWMQLHDNRFDEFARAVLQRLLENNPSYRVLFYHVNVQRQSLVIMDMIGRAVVAFTRPADLMDIMGEVGARHNLYGLQESHFISMRSAFLQVYAEFVGPETYNESVGVWKMFWKTTIELAVNGSTTERGKVYAQRRYKIWASCVNKAVKELIPLQCSGGFHRLMQVTYQNAVSKHPELEKYHQFADLRTAHRCMEAFIRIVKRVVHADSAPVVGYSDQFCVEHIFTDLTEPITVDDLKMIEDSFLEACESFMSAAMWDEVVRVSMQELWSTYITGYWTAQPEQLPVGNTQDSAPDGKEPFCLMFTDIEASTRLWDSDTQTMGTALSHHHKLIRGLIEDFGGYEVKTVGDSFLIATRTVTQALLIAFGIQLELMTGPSAPGFHMVDNTQGAGEASAWRDDALRVRVGIHYCTDASAVYDSVHSRFDYYGPSVNCAARVEAAACGGQVLMSHDAYEHLKTEEAYVKAAVNGLFVEQLGKLVQAQVTRGLDKNSGELSRVAVAMEKGKKQKSSMPASHDARLESSDDDNDDDSARNNTRGRKMMTLQSLTTVTNEGLHPLKGITEPVQLYSLLPLGLNGRVFPDTHLHTFLSLDGSTGSSFSLELTSPLADSEQAESATAVDGLTKVVTN